MGLRGEVHIQSLWASSSAIEQQVYTLCCRGFKSLLAHQFAAEAKLKVDHNLWACGGANPPEVGREFGVGV